MRDQKDVEKLRDAIRVSCFAEPARPQDFCKTAKQRGTQFLGMKHWRPE